MSGDSLVLDSHANFWVCSMCRRQPLAQCLRNCLRISIPLLNSKPWEFNPLRQYSVNCKGMAYRYGIDSNCLR